MSNPTDETLIKIETALAHQQEQIDAMNDMIVRQWKEIDLLKKRLARAMEELAVLDAAVAEGKGEGELSVSDIALRDKPPHY